MVVVMVLRLLTLNMTAPASSTIPTNDFMLKGSISSSFGDGTWVRQYFGAAFDFARRSAQYEL